MASASISRSIHNESRCRNTCSSDFKKTLILEDWWLIKAEKDIEGKRLAVAGFTYRDTHQARRLFSSAPILKIHDVFTLETTDGICVILEGFINKTRTEENGFTSDVFDHFVFGFPPYWEEYAEKCMAEGFTSSRSRNSGKKDKGVEGCEDIVKENEQIKSDCIESSVEVPKEPEVYFESERKNKNSKSVNVSHIPENFLDNNTPRQPIADLATGLTTGVSGFEENGVAPPIEATYINISAKKGKTIRKNERKPKSKTLSGHTKEDTNGPNCNAKLNTTENEALEVSDNLEKENLNNKSSNLPEEISSHSSPFCAELQDPDKQSVKLSSGGANRKKDKNSGKKASISKEASITRKTTKRVLTYETPISRRGKEKATILSPESLSSKRSRSGRLLLPTLEFWRNQTVLYDADRHVSGIKQDPPAVLPSRGNGESGAAVKRKSTSSTKPALRSSPRFSLYKS